MPGRRTCALLGLAGLLASSACAGQTPSTADHSEAEANADADADASGAQARWSYTITVDEALADMDLSLCIEGPRPLRLRTADDAIGFVSDARVRGGPKLERDGQQLVVETLGEHGCLDLELDLEAASAAGGRDSLRRGDTLLLAPDRWLWYPALVPDQLDARARFELPAGVHATVPWPVDDEGWRRLEHTSFGWNAWTVFSRRAPIEFALGPTQFEVAVLDGEREASDAGIETWLRTAASASAELYGEFPRERVAVAVIPTAAWGDSPVLFGVARRGGGGSVMLLLAEHARDEALPGEWVAIHELLHLGMPLITGPWMSEGFVTYYTDVLRARLGLLTTGDGDAQTIRALDKLHRGFEHAHSRLRTLQYASDNMRRLASYRHTYWGGAAIALDLDIQLRHATANRHGLDDMMLALRPLAPEHRRFEASELIARMDQQVAAWAEAGELEDEISIAAIVERHLQARRPPASLEALEGLAVAVDDGHVTLSAIPKPEVEIRQSIFYPHSSPAVQP